MSSDERWLVEHFSLANPRGEGQNDVPALLQRVAETIAGLGEIEVQDVVFHSEIDDGGVSWPTMTVYFHQPES